MGAPGGLDPGARGKIRERLQDWWSGEQGSVREEPLSPWCVSRVRSRPREKQSEHSSSLFSLWVLLVFSVLCSFGVDVYIVTQGSGGGRSNENKEETLQEIKSKLGRILSTDPKGSFDHLLVLKTCTTFSVSFRFQGRGLPS